MRWLVVGLLLPLLAACSFGVCNPSFEPLPTEQLGIMLPDRVDGLGLECRGLEPERCVGMGQSDLPETVDTARAGRVVVSCVGRCTPAGGEMRMDVVQDDETILIANGGYGEFEQSCQ